MQVYRYRDGSRFGVPAQVVGQAIADLEAVHGQVTPGSFVDRARPDDSELHPLLEWDDPTAAEKFRLEQARHVIRSIHAIHVDANGKERPTIGWLHVEMPEVGPCYVSSARAVSDAELKEQVEENARKAFEALRVRYAHIKSLEDVFRAVDHAVQKAATRARPKKKAKIEAEAIP